MEDSIYAIRSGLQSALTGDLNAIFEQVPASPLIFGHICCGVLDRPGALRLSKIVFREPVTAFMKQTPDFQDVEPADLGELHRLAFQEHIRIFGRYATLLDWISRWIYKNCATVDDRRLGDHHVSFLRCAGSAPIAEHVTRKGVRIEVSDELWRTLAPSGVVDGYCLHLYRRVRNPKDPKHLPAAVDTQLSQAILASARVRAYELIVADPGAKACLRRLSQIYRNPRCGALSAENATDEALDWVFLSALQTGLLYVVLARSDGQVPLGFTSGGVVYSRADNDQLQALSEDDRHALVETMPVVVASVVITSEAEADSAGTVVVNRLMDGRCRSDVNKIDKYAQLPNPTALALEHHDNWNEQIIEAFLKSKLETCFAGHALPCWPRACTLWISRVLEALRGAIHEGLPLNFCFVLADLTQLQDSSLFEVIPLANCSVPFPVGDNGQFAADCERFIKDARKEIAKRNYSWFHEGRYALLWDATFPEQNPGYLVRFRNSSWDVFVTACRHGEKFDAARLAVVIGYLRADGTGGIILENENVLSFRKRGKWQSGARKALASPSDGDGDDEFTARIAAVGDGMLNADCQKKLHDALMAISDDPHMGCMLVFLKSHIRASPFATMGGLWRVKPSEGVAAAKGQGVLLRLMELSELISLMAMDGATCVWSDGTDVRIDFRYLIKVPDEDQKKPSNELNETLDGAGSRRWSAAAAACRGDVDMVIAVSQDGPVYIYEPHENDENVVTLKVVEDGAS